MPAYNFFAFRTDKGPLSGVIGLTNQDIRIAFLETHVLSCDQPARQTLEYSFKSYMESTLSMLFCLTSSPQATIKRNPAESPRGVIGVVEIIWISNVCVQSDIAYQKKQRNLSRNGMLRPPQPKV
jgi:hypothetical protein